MIREKGIKPRTIGVEVISDAILARGVTEAAAYLYGCTVPILREVWPEACET